MKVDMGNSLSEMFNKDLSKIATKECIMIELYQCSTTQDFHQVIQRETQLLIKFL